MSKFYEAASKLSPNLVTSVLSQEAGTGAMDSSTELGEARDACQSVPAAAHAGDMRSASSEPLLTLSGETPVSPKSEAILYAREVRVRGRSAGPVLPFEAGYEKVAEEYKILRTKILQHPKSPQIICVTSATMGDGKSLTAINVAGVLALKQHTRVLLLDCDFRHPTVAPLIGESQQEPGLGDVLAGRIDWPAATLRCSEYPNLYIVTAGQHQGKSAELLDSRAWRSGCERLRATFDFIVIDSPPIGILADYDLLQASCDGVVIVARVNHTDRRSLAKALQTFPADKMLGVALNSVERWFLWKTPNEYAYSYENDRAVGTSQTAR